MLVMSRKQGDEILIGENIKITIVEVRKYKSDVRIGIDAPVDVPIVRPDAKDKEPKARNWQP